MVSPSTQCFLLTTLFLVIGVIDISYQLALPTPESKPSHTNREAFFNQSYRDWKKGEGLAASYHDISTCNLPPELLAEIRSYQPIVNAIISEATQRSWKGRTYRNLAKFVDKFGGRMAGSQALEDSIDYVLDLMRFEGLEVHAEAAAVPHWVRGHEDAEMILPRRKKLPIMGLGSSVGTPADGLVADVLVVKSFEELTERAAEAVGKIIVYNMEYISYGGAAQYRAFGAREAARVGGVAALVKSLTSLSLDTPHTGGQVYSDDPTIPQIPVASVTIEDAELLHRLQLAGERLQIKLTMLDYNLPLTMSRNGIGELRGRSRPDESVIVSGHIDSWDVGQGAMDDGGGCAISWESLALLKSMNLVPRRTLRAIMWTAEETGLSGAQEYVRNHLDEVPRIMAAFESDLGTFRPLGLDFAGTEEAGCIVHEILQLFGAINATQYARYESVSTDISFLIALGVPGFENHNANDRYFWYHHSAADTMTMIDSDELDKNLALWAGAAYVIADLTNPLPRAEPKSMTDHNFSAC